MVDVVAAVVVVVVEEVVVVVVVTVGMISLAQDCEEEIFVDTPKGGPSSVRP